MVIRSPAGLRIADGGKYSLRFALGLLECFWAPWVPVDWVVRMLQEVGGLFVYETIDVFVLSIV